MTNFTPLSALIGGVLIGLAAVMLLALNGRIAGVSGIAAGLVAPLHTRIEMMARGWRVLFLLGLIVGTGVAAAFVSSHAAPRTGFPPWALVVAGLLVGYGTSLAGGCTSGHGVCGLARLSLRSLVAVAVFLAVAIATTFIARHLMGIA